MFRIQHGSMDRIEESQKRTTQIWPLIFDKVHKQFSEKWIVFSTDGAGSIEHPYAIK